MSVTAGDERRAATTLNPKALIDYATGSHRRAVGLLLVVSLLCFLPGFLQHPADRSRRGALCAGHQADGGDRRLCRHPVPGRGALQEAGRHLLAAGRDRARRRGDGRRGCAHPHLALPHSLADRRDRRGAHDLLGGAGVPVTTRRRAGGTDDGKLRAAGARAAAGQDRCHATVHHYRGDGRAGAGLSAVVAREARRAERLEARCGVLDRDGGGCAAQGAGQPDGGRACGGDARRRSTAPHAGFWR